MKRIGFLVRFLAVGLFVQQAVQAQSSQPLILIMHADGPIEPVMEGYFQRGIQTAEQRKAEALIIELNTPGGSVLSLLNIIQTIRASAVPVVIYVAPNGAMAASAGALITMAAHVSAMAPEASIGASSPVDSSGADLPTTEATKQKEIMKAAIRPLVEPRGPAALQLAQDMIDNAKAAAASEVLQANLIDFVATDIPDVIKQWDGVSVTLADGQHTLHTSNAQTDAVDMSLIEQLLIILTDSNIVFILLSVGVLALQ